MNDDERATITTKINSKLLSAFLPLLFLLLHLDVINCTKIMNRDMEKRRLLKQFGLEGVPMQSGPNVDIPQHVWDIYHDSDYEVDWIRHYYPNDIIDTHKGFILSYNLSVAARAAQNEQVIKAQLKLRLGSTNSTDLKVYYLDNVETLHLIPNTSNTFDQTWLDFDVTSSISNNNDTVILYVEGAELEQMASTSTMSQLQYSKAQSAPLIVFSDEKWRKRRRRTRRSADTYNERKNRKKGKKHHVYDQAASNLCRKTELYVDFDELGWQDWIMAPKGYEAFQCQGTCPSVMPASLNASNHAIIQSLLHSLNPDDVPPPCCVPVETSPLSILYMDTDNVIVIKEYADMRVESCGCR